MQCFDAAELRRLRNDLDCPFKLVQLIGKSSWLEATTDFDALITADGIRELSNTVDVIGPHISHLYELQEPGGMPVSSGLVRLAQDAGLKVHPFTFRADELPPGFSTFGALVRFFIEDVSVDGLFTDFPDQVLRLRFS